MTQRLRQRREGSGGFVLVVAMLVLMLITLLALAAVLTSTTEIRLSANDRREQEVFFWTEQVLARTMAWLAKLDSPFVEYITRSRGSYPGYTPGQSTVIPPVQLDDRDISRIGEVLDISGQTPPPCDASSNPSVDSYCTVEVYVDPQNLSSVSQPSTTTPVSFLANRKLLVTARVTWDVGGQGSEIIQKTLQTEVDQVALTNYAMLTDQEVVSDRDETGRGCETENSQHSLKAGDAISGPLHYNTTYFVRGNPSFRGPVSLAILGTPYDYDQASVGGCQMSNQTAGGQKVWQASPPTHPDFRGGIESGAPEFNFPDVKSTLAHLKSLAEQDGYYFGRGENGFQSIVNGDRQALRIILRHDVDVNRDVQLDSNGVPQPGTGCVEDRAALPPLTERRDWIAANNGEKDCPDLLDDPGVMVLIQGSIEEYDQGFFSTKVGGRGIWRGRDEDIRPIRMHCGAGEPTCVDLINTCITDDPTGSLYYCTYHAEDPKDLMLWGGQFRARISRAGMLSFFDWGGRPGSPVTPNVSNGELLSDPIMPADLDTCAAGFAPTPQDTDRESTSEPNGGDWMRDKSARIIRPPSNLGATVPDVRNDGIREVYRPQDCSTTTSSTLPIYRANPNSAPGPSNPADFDPTAPLTTQAVQIPYWNLPPNGVVYVEGDVVISGILDGRLTVVAAVDPTTGAGGRIYIDHPIAYEVDPLTHAPDDPENDDMLGLVAEIGIELPNHDDLSDGPKMRARFSYPQPANMDPNYVDADSDPNETIYALLLSFANETDNPSITTCYERAEADSIPFAIDGGGYNSGDTGNYRLDGCAIRNFRVGVYAEEREADENLASSGPPLFEDGEWDDSGTLTIVGGVYQKISGRFNWDLRLNGRDGNGCSNASDGLTCNKVGFDTHVIYDPRLHSFYPPNFPQGSGFIRLSWRELNRDFDITSDSGR